MGSFAAGAGTQRLTPFSPTGNPNIDWSATWNSGGTTFTGIKFNVTDTASAAGSLLMNLQVGGASRFSVEKGAATTRLTISSSGSDGGYGVSLLAGTKEGGIVLTRTGFIAYRGTSINNVFEVNGAAGIFIASGFELSWSSTGGTENSRDLSILRDAADTLAQRRSTNSQTFRIYNTFTDASNYERGFLRWNTNVLQIGTERAGTGTARALELQTNGTTRMTIAASGGQVDFGGTVTCGGDLYAGNLRATNTASIFWNGRIDLSSPLTDVLFMQTTAGNGAALQMTEMTAPAAPAANQVRIYAEDNGAGKTRLMARFATGAAQQIAIEP